MKVQTQTSSLEDLIFLGSYRDKHSLRSVLERTSHLDKEFSEKTLTNNFPISEAKENNSKLLNKRKMADLFVLRTLLLLGDSSALST